MMLNKLISGLAFCLPFFWSCGGGTASYSGDADSTLVNGYANGFTIGFHSGNPIVTVMNPWQGADGVSKEYLLLREGGSAPEGFHGTVVPVPVTKVVCMSSSYIAFIDALGGAGTISGVSGAKYITNTTVRQRYRQGKVYDVGYDNNIDYETIAAMRPDLVLIYGITGEDSSVSGKLAELGIRVMYIGDYVEQSPLGKAEWIKVFGELLDKREEAAVIFDKVSTDYNAMKEAVASRPTAEGMDKPVVMLNAPYRDTWFVPGDNSYMVKLIDDAGGTYASAGVDSEISRPISAESAFVQARGSDIWLNPGQANTMEELKMLNPRFADIPPVRCRRVFNCTKRNTPEGGSDFWESGAVRPDIVLRDMIEIFHPGTFGQHDLYYFRQLL